MLIQEVTKQKQKLVGMLRPAFLNYWRTLDEIDEELGFEALRIRCEDDLQLFAEVFFPHYCTVNWNDFHLDYFSTVKFAERAIRRAWAAPRGAAKSTIVTLIKPIHDVCYALERFILVVSNVLTLACQKLKDIRDEILSNGMLAAVYGLHFTTKKPGEKSFIVVGPSIDTKFMAVGAGSQVRGVRYKEHRPTKIILDDLEHSEKVYSERQRQKVENFVAEDISKLGTATTNIEFVGTVLHPHSCLKKYLSNPAYMGKLYKSIIEWPEARDLWRQWEELYMNIGDVNRLQTAKTFYDKHKETMEKGAKVMWPERESLYFLMTEMMEIGRRAFMKEKQNSPIGADERVFDTVHWFREESTGLFLETTKELIKWDILKEWAYGSLDPSTGQTRASKSKLSDFASLVTGFKEPKGRVLVFKDWTKRQPPTKQIQEIFEHHIKFAYQKFAVETNLYRNLLLPNIIDERKRREKESKRAIKIPFYDVVNTENKDQRIHRLEPKVAHGWILFNRNLSQEAIGQLEAYPFVDHDDFLDGVEMLYGLIHNRYQASAESLQAM